jgi:hypothetical protein
VACSNAGRISVSNPEFSTLVVVLMCRTAGGLEQAPSPRTSRTRANRRIDIPGNTIAQGGPLTFDL